MSENKTWYDLHKEKSTFGNRLADIVASFMGSWKFIIIQTTFVAIWMLLNVVGYINHWDAYPFILLNLLFSTQAAYAAPIIMMSQNRQAERDRERAEHNYRINFRSKLQLDELNQIHVDQKKKINEIHKMLHIVINKLKQE